MPVHFDDERVIPCTYLGFGDGDIKVTITQAIDDKKHNGMAFAVGEPGEIGAITNELTGRRSDDPTIPIPVILQFKNKESLLVVIEEAQRLYKLMEEEEE